MTTLQTAKYIRTNNQTYYVLWFYQYHAI